MPRTNTCPTSLFRYGGWSVEQDELGQLVGKTWFNNKGHHSPPAFYNGMSNMVLRGLLHQHGNMSWDQIKEYGKGTNNDGLVQERRNCSALAMELRLSCTNPSIYQFFAEINTAHCWSWPGTRYNSLCVLVWQKFNAIPVLSNLNQGLKCT